MSNSSIRDLCAEHMRGAGLSGYMRQAEPVIAALEGRESDIAQSLLDFAVENGLSREQAMSALNEVGLTTKFDTTEADPRIAAMEAQINEMQATLRELRG